MRRRIRTSCRPPQPHQQITKDKNKINKREKIDGKASQHVTSEKDPDVHVANKVPTTKNQYKISKIIKFLFLTFQLKSFFILLPREYDVSIGAYSDFSKYMVYIRNTTWPERY